MADAQEVLDRLVEQAGNDPEFFHRLIFNTEEVLGELDYLSRAERGALVAIEPNDVVAGLLGLFRNPGGGLAVCGHSCEDSCDNTCGEGSCFGTCLSDSCDHTCGARSCDVTVEIYQPLSRVGDSLRRLPPRRLTFRPRRRF